MEKSWIFSSRPTFTRLSPSEMLFDFSSPLLLHQHCIFSCVSSSAVKRGLWRLLVRLRLLFQARLHALKPKIEAPAMTFLWKWPHSQSLAFRRLSTLVTGLTSKKRAPSKHPRLFSDSTARPEASGRSTRSSFHSMAPLRFRYRSGGTRILSPRCDGEPLWHPEPRFSHIRSRPVVALAARGS